MSRDQKPGRTRIVDVDRRRSVAREPVAAVEGDVAAATVPADGATATAAPTTLSAVVMAMIFLAAAAIAGLVVAVVPGLGR